MIREKNPKSRVFRDLGFSLQCNSENSPKFDSYLAAHKSLPILHGNINTLPRRQSGAADVGDDDGHGRDATATEETRRDATAMMEEPRRESVAWEA